jgi:Response regulator containing CheY-like receiver domain and AraC-type DNA-binding domain
MKILIAEDEQRTRESIGRELTELGYDNVKQASDGIEALELIEAFRPDVVLADIRMPRMDGLRLLQMMKSAEASPLFVIVSSYDSFEYAQTALEAGAFAYLLKPVATSELQSCLARVKLRLKRNQEDANRLSEADRKARTYIRLAQKQALQQWIEEENMDADDLHSRFKAVDITLPYEKFAVLAAGIDQLEGLAAGGRGSDIRLYNYCIENMTVEMIANLGVEILPFGTENEQGFLINFPAGPLLEEQLTHALNQIVQTVNQYFSFTITIGVGDTVLSLADIHTSFTQAKKAMMTRIAKEGNRTYFYRELESRLSSPSVLIDFEYEQKLFLSMEQNDKEGARLTLEQIYQANGQADNLMKLNFNVAVTLIKLLNRLGLNAETFLGSELKLYRQLNGCTSLERLLQALDEILEVIFAEIKKNEKIWNNSVIAKAMEYILAHYNEDISLQSVSDHINMSPAYLSKQFKKTYQQNFIEFLINYRVDKARELLKSGLYTAHEVSAMVGIKDEKHFFRTFKKVTGVTPGTYKRGKSLPED